MNQLIMILAINTNDYMKIYKNYSEYFSNFNVFKDIIRSMGWIIMKGLVWLAGLLDYMSENAFSFINFLESKSVTDFFNKLKPIIWIVLLFALLYMAFCYLYAHEKPKGVVTNILLFAGTMMILPYMMTQMNQFVKYGKELLQNDTDQQSNYELLVPYIADMVYLDSIDFKASDIAAGKINGYMNAASNIQYLDINEVMDTADYTLKNKELFEKQLVSEIKNGKDTLSVAQIKKSKFFFKDTTPYYYRFHVNFFIAYIYLIALMIVLIFSSFKLISLVMELAAEKIITPFIAAGDLTGGQKIRKALIGILNAYITIICVLFLQRLFMIASAYINNAVWSDNAASNAFMKVFMIVAAALFVIDGPNFFEQIFGVDAGLKSVGQALQSAFYASQMISGVRNTVKSMIGKPLDALKGGVNIAAGGAGMLKGMKDTGAMSKHNQKVSDEMAGKKDGGGEKDSSNESVENSMAGMEAAHSDNSSMSSGDMANRDIEKDLASSGGANQQIADSMKKSSVDNMSGKEGVDHLNSDERLSAGNQNVQDSLNAANDTPIENANLEQAANTQPDINMDQNNQQKDNDNLLNWVSRNTAAGRSVKDNYDRGRQLGHAAGNTINQVHQKKEKKE